MSGPGGAADGFVVISQHDALPLVRRHGVYYRVLAPVAAPDWQCRTAEFLQSGFFRRLQQEGLVLPHFPTPRKFRGLPMLRAATVRPFTRPESWTARQRHEVCALAVRLNLRLQELGAPCLASDVELANFTFYHGRPVYADVGGFSHGVDEARICETLKISARRYGLDLSGETFAQLAAQLMPPAARPRG